MTTAHAVTTAAARLARLLGYSHTAIQTGNASAGISWHATFYRSNPATTPPDRTLRLGGTARESLALLSAMAEGVEMVQPASLFVATLATSHFHFEAAGATELEAREVLAAAWRRHVRQTGAGPFANFAEDIQVTEHRAGVAYRDGSVI